MVLVPWNGTFGSSKSLLPKPPPVPIFMIIAVSIYIIMKK